MHASLLPRYRGAAPVHRAVIAGDAETGVSIMRVVQALDAGAVFATVERRIGPDDTSTDVERDLASLGATLLVQVIDDMVAGRAVETPQDDAGDLRASAPEGRGPARLATAGADHPQPRSRPAAVAARVDVASTGAG